MVGLSQPSRMSPQRGQILPATLLPTPAEQLLLVKQGWLVLVPSQCAAGMDRGQGFISSLVVLSKVVVKPQSLSE